MNDGKKPGQKSSHQTDLLQMIRNKPLPAMLIVAFLVASGLATLGATMFDVYDRATQARADAQEKSIGQLRIIIESGNRDIADCRTRSQQLKQENDALGMPLESTDAGDSQKMALLKSLESCQSLRDSYNAQLVSRGRTIERLELDNGQLRTDLASTGSETKKELEEARARVSKLEKEIADMLQPRHVSLVVSLKEMIVVHDGSSGPTRWKFKVESEGVTRDYSGNFTDDTRSRERPQRANAYPGPDLMDSFQLRSGVGNVVSIAITGESEKSKRALGRYSFITPDLPPGPRKSEEHRVPVYVDSKTEDGVFIFVFDFVLGGSSN